MRLLAYIRVSTDQQSNGIDVQKSAIEEYAKKNNLDVYKFFIDEGVSGKSEKREALNNLFNEVKKGDLVVVQKRDRIARDIALVVFFERHMEKVGAKIISTSGEGTDVDNQSTSFLLRRMIDLFSEHERIVISMRIKEAMRLKKERNEFLGKVPFGKKLHSNGINLEICEKEQYILKKIKKLREKYSEAIVAEKLNKLGLFYRNRLWNRPNLQVIINNNFGNLFKKRIVN